MPIFYFDALIDIICIVTPIAISGSKIRTNKLSVKKITVDKIVTHKKLTDIILILKGIPFPAL
ncbi:hypothetical protein MASR2M117_04910 [Paludibacter sp.]